jgi:hypothetical protein
MDVVEGGTGSYSETCVTCDGTEEVSIKIEDTIDIKEEVSIKVEDTTDTKDEFPPIKTEHEVRLIVKLHFTNSGFVLCFGCHIPLKFEWQFEEKIIVEVITINVRIILECILN